MKKSVILILFIFFAAQITKSQTVFREGYIVKITGDTLKGLVEYSKKKNIPDHCVFKRFDIAKEIKYFSGTIKAYGYKNGNNYEVKTIEGKNYFFECLVRGKINLYKKRNNYFVEKSGYDIVQLTKEKKIIKHEGKEIEIENYFQLLKELFVDNPEIKIPDDLSLSANNLIDLVSAYNNNSMGVNLIYNRKPSLDIYKEATMMTGENMLTYGFVAGMNSYNYSLEKSKDYTRKFVPKTNCPEKSMSAGLFLNQRFSRRNEHISFQIEIIYNYKNFYAYIENQNYRHDVFFNYKAIKLPLMIQYSQPVRDFIFFANLGGGINYFLSDDYLRITEYEYSNHEVNTSEYVDYNFKKYEFSSILGFGTVYRLPADFLISAEVRLELGNGLMNIKDITDEFRQKSTQLNINLGFHF